MNDPPRVLGWDLLRGLCALAVASYHLLLWQEVAALHSFGSYGVYLFFVLSGASLAFTYGDRMRQGEFRFLAFLRVRYVRLAPLFVLLVLACLPWFVRNGIDASFLRRLALNVSFLFGFADPAASSLLIGGWSLGIEAIFYLLFPWLVWTALRGWAGFALFVALLAVQAAWINLTAGAQDGYAANAVAYHQVPAFAAYFMGGCLLGLARRARRTPAWPAPVLLAAVAAGFVLLWLLNPVRAGDELLGWRGVACCTLCFVLAWLAGGLEFGRANASVAAHLGDGTYGLYLIHPVLFFALAWFFIPWFGLPPPERWSLVARIAFALAVIGSAFVLALLSERHFERPLRQWSKRSARG